MIKELSQSELALVAGGNANSNYEGGSSRNNQHNRSSWSHMAQNAPTHIYGGPGTVECANGVFGALAKNFPNAGKMAVGVAKNASKCLSDNGGRGGAFGGDSNANSVNGQCHW
ncbi:hypothetical protein [Rahnella sp. CJA17(1/100)]|uniref:hypothetical protein n=1 Tax=Rahnella sp. CJA17(1/100) TaxID=2508951 RepID=UPI0010704447|nr:hypothetical protein [Rahnella sp. CJA17(1/100)]